MAKSGRNGGIRGDRGRLRKEREREMHLDMKLENREGRSFPSFVSSLSILPSIHPTITYPQRHTGTFSQFFGAAFGMYRDDDKRRRRNTYKSLIICELFTNLICRPGYNSQGREVIIYVVTRIKKLGRIFNFFVNNKFLESNFRLMQ